MITVYCFLSDLKNFEKAVFAILIYCSLKVQLQPNSLLFYSLFILFITLFHFFNSFFLILFIKFNKNRKTSSLFLIRKIIQDWLKHHSEGGANQNNAFVLDNWFKMERASRECKSHFFLLCFSGLSLRCLDDCSCLSLGAVWRATWHIVYVQVRLTMFFERTVVSLGLNVKSSSGIVRWKSDLRPGRAPFFQSRFVWWQVYAFFVRFSLSKLCVVIDRHTTRRLSHDTGTRRGATTTLMVFLPPWLQIGKLFFSGHKKTLQRSCTVYMNTQSLKHPQFQISYDFSRDIISSPWFLERFSFYRSIKSVENAGKYHSSTKNTKHSVPNY